ncbi:MAG TPA: formimidoylglutamate deiminase, partial [Caulobacteraceae bacterium]
MARLWFDTAWLADGWADRVRLTLDGGMIGSIETGVDPEASDGRHGVALPGLGNLHSHAFQRGMAGLAESRGATEDGFWTWREVMYGFLARMTPDDVEALAALAYVEMLESGFTRVGEFHYLHHAADGTPYDNPAEMAERIAAAAAQAGIGLTLLPVFYAHSDFGGAPPTAGQRRFVNDPAGFARVVEGARRAVRGLDGAVSGVAAHSLRAVTPDELQAVAALAPGGPIHIHVAEQRREVEACLAWSGQRPVECLLDHASVDARWCLVHATHVTESELARVAASGASVGLCPITEANLGDGVFPAAAYQALGGSWGVGSDSNVLIDAAEELRLLEYSQRLTGFSRNALVTKAGQSSGATLHQAAARGAARALGAGGQ